MTKMAQPESWRSSAGGGALGTGTAPQPPAAPPQPDWVFYVPDDEDGET